MFDNTIRNGLEEWIVGMWKKTYSCATSGVGLASRNDTYLDGKFLQPINSKIGFPVADCKDARKHRLLEFLTPILYPEKPTRVTIMIGNMIFGALDGEHPID